MFSEKTLFVVSNPSPPPKQPQENQTITHKIANFLGWNLMIFQYLRFDSSPCYYLGWTHERGISLCTHDVTMVKIQENI
jgi:hypothetical protein